MAITRIHVNQHVIRANAKSGERNPVFTVKTKGTNTYGRTVEVLDDDGCITCRVVYSPDKPLSCGAKVWIETMGDVKIYE